jgi:type 1 fimbria pilin
VDGQNAVPRIATGASPVNNTTHVDRYGGTLSGGFRTEHTSTDVGINLSYGSGTDLVPNNLDFTDLKPTTATQLLFYVFLASAYEF